MNAIPNLDRYWGVVLESLVFDPKQMSAALSLFWTEDESRHSATLSFLGITRFQLTTERAYASEVVELISLEACQGNGAIEISGELSNYEFTITCNEIQDSLGQ